MIRRYSVVVLTLIAALALAAVPSAFAQAKRHAHPARTAMTAKRSGTQRMANLGFGVPESLSGTIQMVIADQNLVVVNGPNGVPYDMKITPKTVIVVGDKAGTVETLVGEKGKSVSIGFVPERNGNFATRVEVAG